MHIIRLRDICFQFRSDLPLFQKISAQLESGWCALVGENGCGKSTLLQMLAGLLQPDSGTIQFDRSVHRIHYCPQELLQPDSLLEKFSEDFGKEANLWRDRLELDASQLRRWCTLSAGERKRWQVGAALYSHCDVLLLDEPANHLDGESRVMLMRGLASFQGTGILVSHDRELLDSLTKTTWWLAEGKLDCYATSYSQAKALREVHTQSRQDAYQSAQNKVKNLERRLQQARLNHASAERNRSLSKGNPKDSDSRTIGAQTVKDWAEDRLGRQVRVLRDAKDRAQDALPEFVHASRLGRSIFVDYEEPRQPHLLRLQAETIYAGTQEVLRNVAFTWGRKDRIRIRGVNGAGKSTLLRAMLSTPHAPVNQLLVLPQEHGQAEVRSMVEEVLALHPLVKGRVCTLLAALGCSPQVLGKQGILSPGEARKLHLALGMGKHVWGLVLDEPTNHLDLPSVERLEAALQAFPGAILLVTHDNAFAQKCTNQEIQLVGKALSWG